jgi:hypothetical protein
MTARIVSAEEARGLLEGATPGPWRGDRNDGTVKYAIFAGDEEAPVVVLSVDHKNGTYGFGCGYGDEDETAYGANPDADERLVLAAPDLAHTVIALEGERDAALARVARLERVLAVEGGDKAQAPPGWRPMSDGWVCRNGPVFDGRLSKCPRPDGREVIGSGRWWKAYHDKLVFSPSALEAMEAADAAGEVKP